MNEKSFKVKYTPKSLVTISESGEKEDTNFTKTEDDSLESENLKEFEISEMSERYPIYSNQDVRKSSEKSCALSVLVSEPTQLPDTKEASLVDDKSCLGSEEKKENIHLNQTFLEYLEDDAYLKDMIQNDFLYKIAPNPIDVIPYDHVKLISNDLKEIIIETHYATVSGKIKAIINSPENLENPQLNRIIFRDIPSYILDKICEYFVYQRKYCLTSAEIPKFNIPTEIALELLKASKFLEC
ncbi:hypothetical protein A3Q56_01336 [Intoshia linei]|uniref:Elongin-C n=1 Tax=Intoshia linei TaxID=1819745 RepID=A0A177B9R2_9BILA|nr:hypothetical protein A3Q56_01336 [Intoshia linei]